MATEPTRDAISTALTAIVDATLSKFRTGGWPATSATLTSIRHELMALFGRYGVEYEVTNLRFVEEAGDLRVAIAIDYKLSDARQFPAIAMRLDSGKIDTAVDSKMLDEVKNLFEGIPR